MSCWKTIKVIIYNNTCLVDCHELYLLFHFLYLDYGTKKLDEKMDQVLKKLDDLQIAVERLEKKMEKWTVNWT